MKRFVIIAAVAAVTTLAVANANAADLRVSSQVNHSVHIPVAGKSVAQLRAEIAAAAVTVCGREDAACVDVATSSGDDQLAAITSAREPAAAPKNVDVAMIDATTIRVPVAGKSLAKIQADIRTAAQAVCTATSGGASDNAACVKAAVADAQSQLSVMARNETSHRVAAN
jgi:hypothetical protein